MEAGKKKRKPKAPVNKMTLDRCKRSGWLVGRTEYKVRWNITKDLFGFIDFVAIRPDHVGVLALQVTTFGNRLDRLRKIVGEGCMNEAAAWLKAGNQIEVWGWKRPTTKRRGWALKRDCVILSGTGELECVDIPIT